MNECGGSYSTSIKQGSDASSAIFEGQGCLVAQSDGTPLLHLFSLKPSLQEVTKYFRARYLEFYGVNQPALVQLVNYRTRIVGQVPKLELARMPGGSAGPERVLKNRRPAHFRSAGG